MFLGMSDPEYKNIRSFAEFLADDDREEFSHEDLIRLNMSTRTQISVVRTELESYGFRLAVRAPERRVRGFQTNSNDRYFGPGSSPSHGGSGHEQIGGWAGRKG
jgi:hypothetical protein